MTIFMYYQILCFSFSLIYWFPKSGEYFLGKRSEFFFLEYIFLQNSQNAIYWPTMWISENLRISKHQILKIKIKKSIVKCKLVISTINKTHYKLFSLSDHFQVPGQSLVHLLRPHSHIAYSPSSTNINAQSNALSSLLLLCLCPHSLGAPEGQGLLHWIQLGLVCVDLICEPWNTVLGFCVQSNVGWVFDFLNTNQAWVFGNKIKLKVMRV